MSTGIKETTPKKKLHKLSPRERKFIKYHIEGMTAYDALLKAGYSESVARTQSKAVIGKPRILTAMQKALDKAGINDDMLAGKLKEGLDANKTVSAIGGKDAGAGSVDFVDVPDHSARRQYQDMAHKLRSDYPDPKLDVNHTGAVDVTVEVVKYGKGKGK